MDLVHVADRTWLDFNVGIEIGLVLAWGSISSGSSEGMEINLILVSGHQDWIDFIVGI